MKMNFSNSIGRRAQIRRMAGALAGLVLTGASLEAADYSGRVSDDGVNLSGIAIQFYWTGPFGHTGSGTFYTTTAGSGNNWYSGGWGLGTSIRYVPVQSGYTFTPTYQDVYTGVFGTDSRSDVHFERTSYGVSGAVYQNGAPAGGVTITLFLPGTLQRSATTPANGTFSFAQLPTGTFYITPSQLGYLFVPPSRTTSLAPSQAGQNFTRVSALVTTLAASGVAFGDAVLNGTVTGEGTLTNRVWFEYGTGSAFDQQTPVQNLAVGTTLVPVNAPVENLPAGVIYQCRLVAANVNGTNYGQNVEFTMPYPGALTATSLDGVDDYASVPSAVIPTNGNFTVECWARLPAAGGGTHEILSQGTSGNALYIGISGANLRLGDAWIAPGVPFPSGGWHHFAVVKTNNDTLYYLDGVLRTNKGSAIPNPAATEFRIGRQYGSYGEYWPGAVDEVRVWNVARSPAQILANYQRHLQGSESGLVGYFRFNLQDGLNIPNSVLNTVPATLRNGAALANSGALVRNPVAGTLAPSPVLATRATLRASVNPAEAATVAYFEYGETIAYGSITGGQDIGAGLKYLPVDAVVTDLQPGTTYHYRSVAFNQFGTSYGEDQTFTTLVLGVGWPTSAKVTGGWSDSPKHVVDAEGNAYVAGRFTGSATFKTTINSENGSPDAFVAKLGRGADWLWENRVVLNNPGTIAVHALAVDQARNVYVAGQFSGTATLGTNVLTAVGQTDGFVAKLSSAGSTWLWARAVGAAQSDSANALAVTPAGTVFIAGHFRGTVDLGTNQLVSAGNSQDIFVAKLDTDGNWLWTREAGGTNQNDAALALALNSDMEDVFVTGRFQGTNATFGTTTLRAAGGGNDTDLFIARISTGGLWLLARRGGGSGADTGTGLALDAAGQVYVLGQFGGTADYSGTVSNLNAGTLTNLFVAKLNSNAQMLWYAQAGAGFAEAISVDREGRVYVCGDFTISTAFGSPPAYSLVSGGNSDIFVARLDAASGAWVWARKIGSTGDETRGSIGVDGSGGIVMSGTFQSTVPVGYVLLTTANERDIFVVRLDPDALFEHNTYVIGQPIPVPVEAQDPNREDGGALGQPVITILEKEHADSSSLNSFLWSISERKLYPVRPVTAILKWPLTTDLTNTTSVATAVGRSVFPAQPQIHIADAPVELEPAVPGFPFRFLNLAFTTIDGANVDSQSKQFRAARPGWSVLQFLDTGGELPNPAIHPSKLEVVRTVLWDDPAQLLDNQPATIGSELRHPAHNDPTGKNGYIHFEKAFYDAAGEERAYDRVKRTGLILPVNKDTSATDDDLVVVWYRTNQVTGIAWPSLPVRYLAQWPADTSELVLAGGAGSGVLDPARYPTKRVYNQPDSALPGYNPNEEHAALYGDVLHALRNDLNPVLGISEPYTLLKYRDPVTSQWTMKVFKVVTTNATSDFVYEGVAGQQLPPPAPLSLMSLCGASNLWVSGPGFLDHLGRLYARAAEADGPGTIVARYWYPLQPGFFYDLDGDSEPDAPIGQCLPWLDRLPGGTLGVPVNVTYNVVWPEQTPTLQIGETLLGAKFGLPDFRNFAHASVIFDEGDPSGTNGLTSLVRMFDPLAPRTLQLRPSGDTNFISGAGYSVFRVADADDLFAGLATANDAGLTVFSDLPFALRSRLRYDALNQNLIFRGVLDESQRYGGPDNPLLLLNVLSPRERDRLKQLAGSQVFGDLVDALYDLTRNPNQLDLDGDQLPDKAFLAGLLKNDAGHVVPEVLGAGPKLLSAGQAWSSGYVTIVENDHPSLGGLPVTLHIIRVEGGPVRGDIKVIQSDNVFDEKLTLRHSADFGGEPQRFAFEWYYRPVEAGTDPTVFPTVLTNGNVDQLRGWTQFFAAPPDPTGLNDITLGDGGMSSLLVLADNYFICRYRGYVINGQTNWSDWVGVIGGGQAQLAEGWVKRVRDGLNPFEARTRDFHANETVTFASMLQQAGARYEGDIAFNPDGGNINQIGLIEAYETVLRRAKRLSIEAQPPINYQPANDALLLAGGFIADLYFLLGNEAVADAADPTIGFRTTSAGYGTLAPSIFTFQNQLDSLLEEELALLRGRDDRSATVRLPPVYNRLFWNFTRDEGEVAYAQAYNITDRNGDGFLDATDARIMYPQAHGDAWGHYLTATKTYYALLQNPHFAWIPRSEPILLSGVPVLVDYLDERKFARAAAAKAKVGAEVVDLTYRLSYVDDPAGQYQGYRDTDPARAWGVSEWAQRAGSAALFDWVVANAVLPAVDPNPSHTGLTRIDRVTVPELSEIVAGYEAVQSQMDKADAGLNPLGVAKNSVPFDIDPSLIASGKTHFEQIHERALEAVKNTVTVFNHANQMSQALRGLQDTVNQFSQNVAQQERDLKNRMIEVFGYPYTGDIGPGRTYPASYDGPDIYHYMYVNATELNGEPIYGVTNSITAHYLAISEAFGLVNALSGLARFLFPPDLPSLVTTNTQDVLQVTYPLSAASYGLVAPSDWGQRRAPGELQQALSDLLQSQARLKQSLANYNALIEQIKDAEEMLQAKYNLRWETINVRNQADSTVISLRALGLLSKGAATIFEQVAEAIDSTTAITTESLPKVLGTACDVTAPARGAMKALAEIGSTPFKIGQKIAETVEEGTKTAEGDVRRIESIVIEKAQFEFEVQQKLRELEQLIRQEPGLRLEGFALREALMQNIGKYQATLAKGLRITEERIAFRKNAAAETQASRYQDMTFRIVRNDAIQKYRAQFDLAAQYVYLAAIAYDFETQLLGGRPGAGRNFLTDIVKQRALGEVIDGVPVAGRHGLADPLARLSQNFGVLKGQLGFNNPQTETGRFSLRNEMLRLRDTSDDEWRAELKKCVVANLWDVPEFRRYCRPFAPETAGPQPGLVIRFPTTVTFGLNYFGWPLGGGDSAYDPTLFATKVRSAGVWFEDYLGSGLSQTPRVYLVPAGADVMRSPSGSDLETREWRVVDQKIPVPFPIGFSTLNDPTWIPVNDSLSDIFADIRRFSSFRAFHDSGVFDPSETITDTRLIGRSVWNTDWMLIIPGGTFLSEPNEGLSTFINSVGDIKIFFQTYAYSGN